MNKRVIGMAPGGRMALDRAENRRRAIYHRQKNKGNNNREKNGGRTNEKAHERDPAAES